MAWLKAEYEFASMFSYRIPNFSPYFALSSPLPGPSTVKLAILSTAIERKGIEYGQRIFEVVRNSRVLVEPPGSIALSKILIRRLKQEIIAKKMPQLKKEIGTCSQCNEEKEVWNVDGNLVCKDCASNRITSTFGTREYVHLSGPINVFIEIEGDRKDELKEILRQIRYLGTSDSLVFCRSVLEKSPDERECMRNMTSIKMEGNMIATDLLLLPLVDLRQTVEFREVSPYGDVRNREPFSSSLYSFPLKLQAKGRNWRIYSKITG